MASFYYVTASLPMLLSPGMDPPFESGNFLDLCSRFLGRSDYIRIESADIEPRESVPSIPNDAGCLYRDWEISLRNSLAELRAASQNSNPERFLREGELIPETHSIAQKAMSQSTPLEAELYLNEQRWEKIDTLGSGHFFNLVFLQCYRLKLQIVERCALFNEEKGFAAYSDLYNRVLSVI